MRKVNICEACGEEFGRVFGDIRYLRGVGNMKIKRACKECADDYFESIKAKYFVEEYKGNKFYMYENKFYPYWEASYYYDSIEGCRERTDMGAVAVVNTNEFLMINSMIK